MLLSGFSVVLGMCFLVLIARTMTLGLYEWLTATQYTDSDVYQLLLGCR